MPWPYIHTYIDNVALTQNVLDVIFASHETEENAELNLARRFKREATSSPTRLKSLMTAVLQSDYTGIQTLLLRPGQSVAKNASLLFMHVKISYRDKLPETISPLKYAFKTKDTQMCSLIEKTIREHCPEFIPLFEEHLRAQREEISPELEGPATNKSVTRAIGYYEKIFFKANYDYEQFHLRFIKEFSFKNQTIVVKPGQFATLPQCGTKVILLGVHNRYLWFKHPEHSGLQSTAIDNLLVMNVVNNDCVSAQEFLAVIYLNSNYLNFIVQRNIARYFISDAIPLGQLIGEGIDGDVYQSTYQDNAVAIKALKKTDEKLAELIALTMIKDTIPANAFLVKFYGYFERQTPHLVFEFMNQKTVADFIAPDSKTYQIDLCPLIIERTACALKLLHTHQLIHRDVKPANIFLHAEEINGQSQLIAKLGDFGFTIFQDWQTGLYCTPSFLAPEFLKFFQSTELLLGAAGSFEADMFALGITVWTLINRTPLYPQCHNLEQLKHVVCRLEKIPAHGVSTDALPVLKKMAAINSWCTQFHPKQRPTAAQMVNEFAGEDKLAMSEELIKYAP